MEPRDVPRYTIPEAAQYLHVAPSTLRGWVLGRYYTVQEGKRFSQPIIRVADETEHLLSFNNLVEAHVLRALRTKHDVGMHAIRKAMDYAEESLGIDRLLLRNELRTKQGQLFWDTYVSLIHLNRAGQLALRALVAAYMDRIDRDEFALPVRLYPLVRNGDTRKTIVIDPKISFGQPFIREKGVTTDALVDRINAGESVETVLDDYNLQQDELDDALVYAYRMAA